MPIYITLEDVKLRLTGKVLFTTDPDVENRMLEDLADRLIDEAEGQVEMDLSPRYAAPFQTSDDGDFAALPDRPTREVLRTLCELKAVMRILETDFGSGSAIDGDAYAKPIKKRYDEMVERLLAKRKDGGVESQGWLYPPLVGLKLMWGNMMADDGFSGRVIVASGSPFPGYAAGQVNDPADSFWASWSGSWPYER